MDRAPNPMVAHYLRMVCLKAKKLSVRISLVILLVVGCPWLISPSWSDEGNAAQSSGFFYPKILRYGVLNAMSGIDKEDAQVAVQMNFDRLNKDYDPSFNVTLEFLKDAPSAAVKIKSKEIHALSITGTDFIRLRNLVPVKPLFITSKSKHSPLEPYVLITKNAASLEELAAMPQRRLMIESNKDWNIGRIWLETVLHEKGMRGVSSFFTSIQTNQKSIRLILPVFFGKADACLVSQSAYDTMVELNPQIGNNLRILMRSPGFVKNLVCIANYLDPKFVKRMKESLIDLHNSEEGRQILIIFQHKRNFVFKKEYLIETQRVFRNYQKLSHAKK